MEAARRGDLAEVKAAVLADSKSVNAQDEDKVTLLHWACANGDYEMVCLLLDKGVREHVHQETISERHVCYLYSYSFPFLLLDIPFSKL